MASFQHDDELSTNYAHHALPQMASSLNLQNSAFKPKVDISSFSPRDGSAFLGHSTTPRDASRVLDSACRMETNQTLQEVNRNLTLELQECQHKLRNAEQRALQAESELRAIQTAVSPIDMDMSVEVSQISKRLPSPRWDSLLRGNSSRRPASRNGGDESDVRCENLLLVIDDLRSRLASATQDIVKSSSSVIGDESDLWRFATMREQLRWADNLALDQSKKKEAALSSLRGVIASCQKTIRLTPRHLLPENFNAHSSFEDGYEDAQQWIQRLLHVHGAVISKVLSLENRNLELENQCQELRKTLVSHQIARKSDSFTDSFDETIFNMLAAHDDGMSLPTKPTTYGNTLSERETARNLSGEFLLCSPGSSSNKKKKIIHVLKLFIQKYEFMQDILDKLARNMNDQVALVDSILSEFQNLVKCNNSDQQFYGIQRSFQFVHQELMRLDECFHLISKRPSNDYVDADTLWKV